MPRGKNNPWGRFIKGPNKWRKRADNQKRFHPCRMDTLECQSPEPPDKQCCAEHQCFLCVEWFCDTDQRHLYGELEYILGSDRYEGELNSGQSVIAYWEWNPLLERCEFKWFIQGSHVATFVQCDPLPTDDGTVTCYDPSGTFRWTDIDNDFEECEGDFTFRSRRDRRLERSPIPETQCWRPYCGAYDCTCDELCYQIQVVDTSTDPETIVCNAGGVIEWAGDSDEACPVSNPSWEGDAQCLGLVTSEQLRLHIDLIRNAAGNCAVEGTLDNLTGGLWSSQLTLDEVEVIPLTESLTASWTVSDGDLEITITINCARCGECGIQTECCSNPIPFQLTIDWQGLPVNPMPGADDCSCTDGQFALNYAQTGPILGAFAGWETALIPWCAPNSNFGAGIPAVHYYGFALYCLTGVWTLKVGLMDINGTEIVGLSFLQSPDVSTCEPFLLEWTTPMDPFNSQCQPGMVPHFYEATIS